MVAKPLLASRFNLRDELAELLRNLKGLLADPYVTGTRFLEASALSRRWHSATLPEATFVNARTTLFPHIHVD